MCVITEKKLQLNIARLCCHNFLSSVVFQLGGGGLPGTLPGYDYGTVRLFCSGIGTVRFKN